MEKQRILDEIARTASENGGKPLGVTRFNKETGIKESDWRGRYWARWGDALSEAGFAPNQMVVAFDEKEVIEKFIELIKRLGRIPTRAELQMERRTDPKFPSANVFARFGSKEDLVQRIADYCVEKPGLEGIATICLEIGGPKKSTQPASKESFLTEDFGFVYLMKSGRYYKIGRSNSVGRREYDLAIQLPEKITTVHKISTDDPVGIEAYWHNRFKAKRKNGEWFDLDATDIKAFKRRKFM